MLSEADLLRPTWPAPANVQTLQTTRHGGISVSPYDTFNLGDHVDDHPLHVAANRQQLNVFVPSEPVWMRQVHGVRVIDAGQTSCLPEADAAVARVRNAVCAVMTADCLPLLLCDQAGTVVAAVHAGWRGLTTGVIEAAVSAMQVEPDTLLAWLGPAIGPTAFEVGDEVRQTFVEHAPEAEAAFRSAPAVAGHPKWHADLYALARLRLAALGAVQVYGGEHCTYSESDRFFSYRRDGVTGRMASLIWLS